MKHGLRHKRNLVRGLCFFIKKKLAIYPYRVYNLNYEKYKEIR